MRVLQAAAGCQLAAFSAGGSPGEGASSTLPCLLAGSLSWGLWHGGPASHWPLARGWPWVLVAPSHFLWCCPLHGQFPAAVCFFRASKRASVPGLHRWSLIECSLTVGVTSPVHCNLRPDVLSVTSAILWFRSKSQVPPAFREGVVSVTPQLVSSPTSDSWAWPCDFFSSTFQALTYSDISLFVCLSGRGRPGGRAERGSGLRAAGVKQRSQPGQSNQCSVSRWRAVGGSGRLTLVGFKSAPR